MAFADFRIAAGWNVALGSLTNVENISQIMYPPKVTPVDGYPVRRIALSGKVYGDGRIDHVWEYRSITTTALYYIIDTYLSTATSAAVTIYTLSRVGTYARYNATLVLPQPGVDYDVAGTVVENLRLRFNGLVAL